MGAVITSLSPEPKPVADWLAKRVTDGRWFVESLPPILEAFAKVRNPAAHERRADRAGRGSVGERRRSLRRPQR